MLQAIFSPRNTVSAVMNRTFWLDKTHTHTGVYTSLRETCTRHDAHATYIHLSHTHTHSANHDHDAAEYSGDELAADTEKRTNAHTRRGTHIYPLKRTCNDTHMRTLIRKRK
eukprot:GHVU01225237.1.p1 GENE.GHVU01225237.1~~GHVU01225237.1.p1  ORF type:complete len:112 (-),score=4.99 GHVU01225237.1:64-399(-)